MAQKLNKKYIISRKIWVIGSLIAIPVVLLIIYLFIGFLGNRITPKLKEAFSVDKIDYKAGDTMSDFYFNVKLTSYTKATEGNTDGSISYSYTYYNYDSCSATNIKTVMVIGDYWSGYVSTVSSTCKESRSSIGTESSTTTDTGTISSIAYSNKNSFGVTVNVSNTPNVYIYITYDFEDENSNTSSHEYVLTYSFKDIFKGSII